MILNYYDRSNWVSIVTKTRYENYVTYRIDALYVKNETELSWPIRSGMVYHETREDNYVTDCVSLVHIKIETELLGPIWPCAIYDEN